MLSKDSTGRSRRWLALLMIAVLALGATACGRSGDEESNNNDDEEEPSDNGNSSGGGSGLDKGEFGDMGVVCQDGDAAGATDTGVTDGEIRVGTVTNKGAEVRPGLNKEMADVAKAFTDWCNEKGGINGRKLVFEDLDAKLNEYPQRVAESCEDTFALVGGGAIFDNDTAGTREACDLANIAGFVVSPSARAAGQQVQPLPNPVYSLPVQHYKAIQKRHPDAKKLGLLYVELEGVTTVHAQIKEAYTDLGFDVAYDTTYLPAGETGWRGFVQSMKQKGVQVVELVGEPENMTALLGAMATEAWYPEAISMQPNMYEAKFEEEAKGAADDTDIFTRLVFPTFDMTDEFPGMADYIELMETYNKDGKYPALLGAQGLSAWLLFAKAANECGSDLTRACLLEKAQATTEWTAGGLHAPTTPGNAEAAPCGIIVRFNQDGFSYDEEVTEPTDGVFNCSPDNVAVLDDDYGVPEPTE